MPDFFDQRLRKAFMDFRDDVQVEIEPPGTDAVRTSVGRRRRIRTTATACGLALALVGAWVLLRPVGPTTVPSGPPAIDYTRSLGAAFTRAGYPNHLSLRLDDDDPFWWGNTVSIPTGPRAFTYTGQPGGVGLTITAACVGGGSITVFWNAAGEAGQSPDEAGQSWVSCGADGAAVTGQIPLTRPDMTVVVMVLGDHQVADGGAFVVAMTDPRSVAAQAALGPSDPDVVFGDAIGTTYDPYTQVTQSASLGPGRYRFNLVCVGDPDPVAPQEIRVWVMLNDRVAEVVPCPADGGRLERDVSSPTAEDLRVSIDEAGSYGYAYRVTRIADQP